MVIVPPLTRISSRRIKHRAKTQPHGVVEIVHCLHAESYPPDIGGNMLSQIAKVFCLVIALGLAASPAFAQARSSSADITGVVRDPGRSVVRGAMVKATNIAIGLTRMAITDTNGAYRIPLLPPGVYEVKIEVKGFNTQIIKDITLTVGQVLTLNFDLALGSPKVIIETAQPFIETERTHQSSTITQ